MRLWWACLGCWAACGGEPRGEVDTVELEADAVVEVTPDVARDEETAPEVVLPERATYRAQIRNTWPLTGTVAGARVSLYDAPEVAAISDDDGYVSLEVERDRRVLALVEAEGYMDTLVVLPAPRDQDIGMPVDVLEVGQLATLYRTDSVGSTLAPEPGRAHVKMTVVHPVPSYAIALGATLDVAARVHYAPWPPNVAPVEPFGGVTARGSAYVPNLEPTAAYAMTATSGFGTPCESAAASGDYEHDFAVPLRADTLTVGFVLCPVPEGKAVATGTLRDPLGDIHAPSPVCEWGTDNCTTSDAQGTFRLLVTASPRLVLQLVLPGNSAPQLLPISRLVDYAFELDAPVGSPTWQEFVSDSAMFARRVGLEPPPPTSVAKLEVQVQTAASIVALDPASDNGWVTATELYEVEPREQLGTVFVPNLVPDAAPGRLFRLRFAAPLPERCWTPWLEDPQTLVVPAEPGHITRIDIGPCD